MADDTVVCDASVSAKWVLREDLSDVALDLLEQWAVEGVEISVPPLWEYELDSIIRHHAYRGELLAEDVARAKMELETAGVTIRYLPAIRSRAAEIASQANQRRVYDSVYAAHAEAEGCVLWTADHAYYRAVRGVLSHVRYLGDL